MHKLPIAAAALLLPQGLCAHDPDEHYGDSSIPWILHGFMRHEAALLGSTSARGMEAFIAGYGCRPAAAAGEVDCLRHVALSRDGVLTWVLREGRFARAGADWEWRSVASERRADWRLFGTTARDMGPHNAFYDAASIRRAGSGFAVRYVVTTAMSGVGHRIYLWDVAIDCDPAAAGPLPVRPGGGSQFLRSRDERHLPELKRLLCPLSP